MSVSLLGAMVTAGVLGVTHAVEPDHIAGIASLTGRNGGARLSALVGACFSLGHVTLVVGWLSVGYLLLGRTEFAPIYEIVGTVGVGLMLGLVGAAMAFDGLREMRRLSRSERPADDETRTHARRHGHGNDDGHTHFLFPFGRLGGTSSGNGQHRSVGAYFRTGVVGALFTLSPPLSMITFGATLLPTRGPGAVTLAVAAYAVAITATMGAVGAAAGAAFRTTWSLDPYVHAGVRTLAGSLVVGLAATLVYGAIPLVG